MATRMSNYPGFELPQHQAAVNAAAAESPRPAHQAIDELKMALERLSKVIGNLDARLQPIANLPESPTPSKPAATCEPYAQGSPLTENLRKFTRAIHENCDRINQMECSLDI